MTFFESHIPDFLTQGKNTRWQLIFTSAFALIFINLYAPFGVDTWYNLTQAQLFFYSSLVILAGLVIIAISRIFMHIYSQRKKLSNGNYMLWIAAEIVSLSVVYVILQHFAVSPVEDVVVSFRETLKLTSLVLLLPYVISYLYFSWMEKNRRLEQLTRSADSRPENLPAFIALKDEKGELRLSIKGEDLLYLEAADNYVEVYYQDGEKEARFVIRNSLKNFEQSLAEHKVIRCHRSYMVNFRRVKMVKKERDGLVVELESKGRKNVPVSKSYVDQVMKMFSETI